MFVLCRFVFEKSWMSNLKIQLLELPDRGFLIKSVRKFFTSSYIPTMKENNI